MPRLLWWFYPGTEPDFQPDVSPDGRREIWLHLPSATQGNMQCFTSVVSRHYLVTPGHYPRQACAQGERGSSDGVPWELGWHLLPTNERNSPVSDLVQLAAFAGPTRKVSTVSAQKHVGLSTHHSQCSLGNLRVV